MLLKDISERRAVERLCSLLYSSGDVLRPPDDLLRTKREERQPGSGLHRISRSLARGVRLGPGHDAAVVSPAAGHDLVLSTDVQVAGTHFDLEVMGAEDAGRRSVLAAVSDLAPFGAVPQWLLLSVAADPETELELLERLYRGLGRAADEIPLPFNVNDWNKLVFVGGDLVVTRGPLTIDVVVLGRRPNTWATGGRDGARPGDVVYLSGPTGLAAGGWWHLSHPDDDIAGSEKLRKAFLQPEIELQLGAALWRDGLLTSAADTSDSLTEQLEHLAAASGVGLLIETESLPMPGPLVNAAEAMGLEPLELACGGGEDFRLLVTGPAGMERTEHRLTPIGRVVDPGEDLRLLGADGFKRELPPPLFSHFSRD